MHSILLLAALLAQDPKLADPHPLVAGFERSGAEDPLEGGRLLIGELNCVACHRSDSAVDAKKSPLLGDVGSRLRPEWLMKWIADPQSVKPGTTMPNPRVAKGDVEPLVHYMMSLKSTAPLAPPAGGAGKAKEIFNRAGCAACHAPMGENVDLKGDRAVIPRGDLKEKYSGAGALAHFLLDPLKWRPSGRMPKMNLTPQEAMAIATLAIGLPPRGADDPGETVAGLAFEGYEGNWSRLPEFESLKPYATGVVAQFDVKAAKRDDHFGLRFRGYLEIPRDGLYTFSTHSDDGSRLLIGRTLVVDNDGVHGGQTATGAIQLQKGKHAITVEFFEGGGGEELSVLWEGPGISSAPIPAKALSRRADGQFALADAASGAAPFVVDPASAKRGREAFLKACVSCHQVEKGDKAVESKPLAALAEGECKGPAYALTAKQSAAIKAALASPVSPDRLRRTMLALNCSACHERNGKGGPEAGRDPYFITTGDDLGEEGRIPPHLTGVGAKLRKEWLQNVLANGTKVRPYMQTRMPAFGTANVVFLADEFEKADPAPAAPAAARDRELVKAGRQLMGTKGLQCITCHTFAGHKSLGIQGMDMTLMAQRLRRDWYGKYLIDPPSLRPGTRMPTFWPEGKSVLKTVLEGDTTQQIEATWQYLLDGNKAQIPVGIGPQPIPLEVKDEAVIYRNFIQGAGPRAIAVGHPERAHMAFDANSMRLALLWQGDFIDASKHWLDRGSGFQSPMGDRVAAMHDGIPFAALADTTAAWPKEKGREAGYVFGGYDLDKVRRPTFAYSFRGVEVRDFFEGVATKPAPSFKRTLTFEAKEAPAHLWYRAAVGKKIDRLDDGGYAIDGGMKMRFELPAGDVPTVRSSGGNSELLVPLKLRDGRLKVVQTYAW